jgi:hypothetical protein
MDVFSDTFMGVGPAGSGLSQSLCYTAGACCTDWISSRMHEIARKVDLAEGTLSCGAPSPSGEAAPSSRDAVDELSLDDVRWLLAVLQRRDAIVRRIEDIWEQWHARQSVSVGELTLTSELRTALRSRGPQ